jgi:class 3 adenylate cyclase
MPRRFSPGRPDTRFAPTPNGHIAYQVFGRESPDILFITNWITNLDVIWDEPSAARFFDHLADIGRIIMLDKRGSGVSDPPKGDYIDPLGDTVDDVRAVLQEIGSRDTVLVGDTEGGMLACVLAASSPEQFPKLILLNSLARLARADDYPIGAPRHLIENWSAGWRRFYGVAGDTLDLTAPSVAADRRFREWYVRYQRLSMAPTVARQAVDWITETDVRSVLPCIQAHTLVIHRRDPLFLRLAFGEFLAANIPGAELLVVEGADTHPFHAGDTAAILEHIRAFVTGERRTVESNRQLATVLFSDIIGSTEMASRLGDELWLDLRSDHDKLVRANLGRFSGTEWAHTGDGFVASFEGPRRAIQCAIAMAADLERLGVGIRVGIHTGEVEIRDGELGGLAVHIASRVMGEVDFPGVMVSGTVKDLVVGSNLEFIDRGRFDLRGVPGTWNLYEVRSPGATPEPAGIGQGGTETVDGPGTA